jgi:4,5-dihydroxyphthalate decarboxylase
LSELLLAGEIDALIGPRTPSAMTAANREIGWLFPDPRGAAIENYRRTKNFPIMHLIGVRRRLAESHPWLPAAVLKAFERRSLTACCRRKALQRTKLLPRSGGQTTRCCARLLKASKAQMADVPRPRIAASTP